MSGIGALSERIVLLRPVRAPDGGGGHAITFEARETVWASAEDRPAARSTLGDRSPRPRRRFTARAEAEILFETRIQHDGVTFRVTDIRRDRADRFQTIETEAL